MATSHSGTLQLDKRHTFSR